MEGLIKGVGILIAIVVGLSILVFVFVPVGIVFGLGVSIRNYALAFYTNIDFKNT